MTSNLMALLRIEINQGFMLIEKKKDLHRQVKSDMSLVWSLCVMLDTPTIWESIRTSSDMSELCAIV